MINYKNFKKIKCIIKQLNLIQRNKCKVLVSMKYFYTVVFVIFNILMNFFPIFLFSIFSYESKNESLLYISIGFLGILCLFSIVTNYILEVAKSKISYLRIDYLAEAFNKIITTDYKYMEEASFFNKYDSAFDACSNSQSGIEKIYNIMFELPAYLWYGIICSGIVCFFSPSVVIVVFMYILLEVIIKKQISSYKYSIKEKLSKINRKKRYFNTVTQDFQYGKDIRLFGIKDLLMTKYEEQIQQYKTIILNIKKREFGYTFILIIAECTIDLVIYLSLFMQSNEHISLYNIMLYFLATSRLKQIMKKLIYGISYIYEEGLYVSDYFEFINTNFQYKSIGDRISEQETYSIEFKNFSFKYPNTDIYVLKQINMKINKGEKIAIIGDNGVGKTTMIKVLLGLFREFEGEILINDTSLKKMSNDSIFDIFSIVFQEVNLLAFSVAENIACKSKNIKETYIYEILEVLKLKEKVSNSKKGIYQQIHRIFDKDGLEFSGGENQKITIARALYKNGKILVLDEPTSALDAIAEKEIYENFKHISKNYTTIFISHRLASTKFCDKIFVIGKEGVLEQGTHDQLMKQKGIYYNTFMVQAKYYRGD